MEALDIKNALHILATIPTINQYDRVVLYADGSFGVDRYHHYTGYIGRSCLDKLVGGYNRRDIVRGIEDLITQLLRVAQECSSKLDSVYVVGNFRAYGMKTPDTILYTDYLRQLWINVCNIRDLVDTCKLIYLSDAVITALLEDCLKDIRRMSRIIDPFIPRLHGSTDG